MTGTRGITPDVRIRSPIFIFSVARMYRFISPWATRAIKAVRSRVVIISMTFSTRGGPEVGPTLLKSIKCQ